MSNKWPYIDIMALHNAVTGSCHLVCARLSEQVSIHFLVDIGLFQEDLYREYNYSLPFDAEKIDFCLITHNHVDHTGRLPFLVKNGFCNKVYATEDTCTLLPLALYDSYKVLKNTSKRRNVPCLYSEDDVEKSLELLTPCKYFESFYIGNYVKVTFLSNGHLVGAASILVQISYPDCDDINLLFTGDYNNQNIFFDVEPIPDWVLNLPITVIQESTYGNMLSSDMNDCFEDNLLSSIGKGDSVIVPVFSLGRSQEILYVLKCMQDNGVLDVNVPIYFDGNLGIRYTRLYVKKLLNIKSEMVDFLPQNLTFVDKSNRCEVLADTGTKIVLTTSGMGSYGPAQLYIPEYVSRENSLIHFTGFTSENSLGGRLKNTPIGESVQVGGLMVKKLSKVCYTTQFSAHAKADVMIEFLKQFKNLRMVLLNHGEPDVQNVFANLILEEVNTRNVGLLSRSYFFRVGPYGLVKTFSTKFQ